MRSGTGTKSLRVGLSASDRDRPAAAQRAVEPDARLSRASLICTSVSWDENKVCWACSRVSRSTTPSRYCSSEMRKASVAFSTCSVGQPLALGQAGGAAQRALDIGERAQHGACDRWRPVSASCALAIVALRGQPCRRRKWLCSSEAPTLQARLLGLIRLEIAELRTRHCRSSPIAGRKAARAASRLAWAARELASASAMSGPALQQGRRQARLDRRRDDAFQRVPFTSKPSGTLPSRIASA